MYEVFHPLNLTVLDYLIVLNVHDVYTHTMYSAIDNATFAKKQHLIIKIIVIKLK